MSSDTSKYGVHTEASCDGCSIKPITGFRYKCTKCADHDLCENCYTSFQSGTLLHTNKLNANVSKDITAHAFAAYADGKHFTAMTGAKKQEPIKRTTAKVKPNDPCPCGSGSKAKKCCSKA